MSAFFFQRINDHIQYLRRLEQTLKDQGDFRGYDFHSCKLGQWIDTEGPSQIPEGADKAKLVFAEMNTVHEHFHQTGERALAAKEANDPAAVRQAVTDMLKDSNILVAKLMELDRVCKDLTQFQGNLMNDMDPVHVAGNAVQTTLTYFDGQQRSVLASTTEVPYPEGKLIVSRTDTRGIITQCNQAFIDMSGYQESELIGQPHCLLRHPDMPKAAYADLWATVNAGKKWDGYVKNLRKDGSHYWVHAVVVPNVRNGQIVGFTSVRRKPSRSKVDASAALYVDMKAKETA